MRGIGFLVIGLIAAAPAHAQPPDWARNSAPGAVLPNLPQPGYYRERENERRGGFEGERGLENERAVAHERSFGQERNLEHQRGLQQQHQSLRSQQVASANAGNDVGKGSATGAAPSRVRGRTAAAPPATSAPATASRGAGSKCVGAGRCAK
jgi:hypothetical protein